MMRPRYIFIGTIILLYLLFSASGASPEERSTAHFIAPVTLCLPTCTASTPMILQGDPSDAPVNGSIGWTAFGNLSAPDLGPNGDVVRFVRGEKQPPPISDACITVIKGSDIDLQRLKDFFVNTTLFKDDKIFNDNGTVRSWRVLLPVLDRSCDGPCTNPPNCACPPSGQGDINERFHVGKCANILITDIITDGAHKGIVVEEIECSDCSDYYAREEVTPNLQNFGSVNVETSSTPETFTISNTGTVDLVIDSIILTDPATGLISKEFSKQDDDCTGYLIAPSSNCKLQVIFAPTSGGKKKAILSIASNSSRNPHEISLTGEGTTPVYSLSVGNISGAGSVSATDINCPPDCSQSYHAGTNVVLTAVPDAGWYFASWGGDILGNMNPYSLPVNSNKNITVTFKNIDTEGNAKKDAGRHTDDHGKLVYSLIVRDDKYSGYVGSVSASDDERNITVTYAIDTGDWELSEIHLHVATSVEGIPKRKNGCLDPDHFSYQGRPVGQFKSRTFTIPISSILGSNPPPGTYTIYVAAEATVTQSFDRGSRHLAWGDDQSYPCKEWSSYISYPLNINP